jgi:hypothetical protein
MSINYGQEICDVGADEHEEAEGKQKLPGRPPPNIPIYTKNTSEECN